MQSWIDEALAGGAEVLAGGKLSDDGVLRPTVLGSVPASACFHQTLCPDARGFKKRRRGSART